MRSTPRRAAVSEGGSNGSRRILVPALLAVAVGAIMLALSAEGAQPSPGIPGRLHAASQAAAYTDTTTTGWMTREEQWLLDGKHAYLAAADAAGVSAFEQFLESHGVPFLVDRRGDAVVFSAQQT